MICWRHTTPIFEEVNNTPIDCINRPNSKGATLWGGWNPLLHGQKFGDSDETEYAADLPVQTWNKDQCISCSHQLIQRPTKSWNMFNILCHKCWNIPNVQYRSCSTPSYQVFFKSPKCFNHQPPPSHPFPSPCFATRLGFPLQLLNFVGRAEEPLQQPLVLRHRGRAVAVGFFALGGEVLWWHGTSRSRGKSDVSFQTCRLTSKRWKMSKITGNVLEFGYC